MTLRQLLLRDGVGGQAPAIRLVGQFRCPGVVPAGSRLPPGTAATSRLGEDAGRSCPQYDGVTGPSVV